MLSELSGEIFRFSTTTPLAAWMQQLSIVSASYKGEIAAADIRVHPTGKFLYTSNRGDANEIVAFRIDQRNGNLSFLQRISCEGSSPRSLAISADGKTLLAANEQSDNITIFRISPDGRLKYTGRELKVAKPACVKFIDGKT
jgi:6-phosphogluconolactonase